MGNQKAEYKSGEEMWKFWGHWLVTYEWSSAVRNMHNVKKVYFIAADSHIFTLQSDICI